MKGNIIMLEAFMLAGSDPIANRETAAAETSAGILPFPPRIICTPQDMASLLLQASPLRARQFAVQMQERACQSADQSWADFWLHVIRGIAAPYNQEDAT